jgi:hypothetical protein
MEVVFISSSKPYEFAIEVKNYIKWGYRIVPHTIISVYENVSSGNSYGIMSDKGLFACEMIKYEKKETEKELNDQQVIKNFWENIDYKKELKRLIEEMKDDPKSSFIDIQNLK